MNVFSMTDNELYREKVRLESAVCKVNEEIRKITEPLRDEREKIEEEIAFIDREIAERRKREGGSWVYMT